MPDGPVRDGPSGELLARLRPINGEYDWFQCAYSCSNYFFLTGSLASKLHQPGLDPRLHRAITNQIDQIARGERPAFRREMRGGSVLTVGDQLRVENYLLQTPLIPAGSQVVSNSVAVWNSDQSLRQNFRLGADGPVANSDVFVYPPAEPELDLPIGFLRSRFQNLLESLHDFHAAPATNDVHSHWRLIGDARPSESCEVHYEIECSGEEDYYPTTIRATACDGTRTTFTSATIHVAGLGWVPVDCRVFVESPAAEPLACMNWHFLSYVAHPRSTTNDFRLNIPTGSHVSDYTLPLSVVGFTMGLRYPTLAELRAMSTNLNAIVQYQREAELAALAPPNRSAPMRWAFLGLCSVIVLLPAYIVHRRARSY